MKTYLKIVFLVALTYNTTKVYAEDDSYINYDDIVSQLSSSRALANDNSDPFDNIRIHLGLGLSSSYISLNNPGNANDRGYLEGFAFSLGIDLFSPNWAAEGVVRSYGESKVGISKASMKEFDLKVLYKPSLTESIKMHFGLGLAARYLLYTHTVNGQMIESTHTTPASIFNVGIDGFIGDNFSMGPEISVRSPLISDTIESTTVAGGLRFDAHF